MADPLPIRPVVPEEYCDYQRYVGTRADLIATGVVSSDRPLPGEDGSTGRRGERFIDANGRRCVVSKWAHPRHLPQTFCVRVYRTPAELAAIEAERQTKERDRHAAEARKRQERREINLQIAAQYRMKLDWSDRQLAEEARERFASLVRIHEDMAYERPLDSPITAVADTAAPVAQPRGGLQLVRSSADGVSHG